MANPWITKGEIMSRDTVLECPECGKPGFVRIHNDSEIFECVYCKYRVDLTESTTLGPIGWLTALLAAIVVVSLLI